MDDKKIAFIICSNSEVWCEETCWWINHLEVPTGFQVDILVVKEAKSMTSGYNEAMKVSDAKYKVYLHQDLFILRKDFLHCLLKAFENDEIGMVGLLGTDKLVSHAHFATSWDLGGVYTDCSMLTAKVNFYEVKGNRQEVVEAKYIDGMLMATQYDLEWDEEHYDRWDFYDIAQCQTFLEDGYKIGILNSDRVFALHDSGYASYKEYDKYRKIFCSINKGFLYEEVDLEKTIPLYWMSDDVVQVKPQMREAIEQHDFEKAYQLRRQFLNHIVSDTEFTYLCKYLEIYTGEEQTGRTSSVLRFSSFDEFIDVYDLIKFLVRRIEFGYTEENVQMLIDFIEDETISMEWLGQIALRDCVNGKKVLETILKTLDA